MCRQLPDVRHGDKENLAALLMMQFGLAVDLGDQRASRVDGEDIARFGILWNRFRHAMRGKDNRFRRIFHLVELLDENRALGLQPFDDILLCTIS